MPDRCEAHTLFFTVFAHGAREKNVACGTHDDKGHFDCNVSLPTGTYSHTARWHLALMECRNDDTLLFGATGKE